MSSAECLRQFVNERLTAAAEEIFRVFHKTIVQYQEEVDRQRRLLEIVLKPGIKLQRIELPQQHVCKQEEDLAEQQLCIQERSSSLDQEDPEPPQIKEEEEELCSGQEGEQLVLKQETDDFTLMAPYEESDHSEDPTLNLNPDALSAAETEHSYHHLLFHNAPETASRHQKGGEHKDSGPKPKKRRHSNNKNNSKLPKGHGDTPAGKKSFECETCGKSFKLKSRWYEHQSAHKGEKPHTCKTCGKDFRRMRSLLLHVRAHTGEMPCDCKYCGKRFAWNSALKSHMRIHTDERPYSCTTCGKRFRRNGTMRIHMKTHTGERTHHCKRRKGSSTRHR